MRQEGKGRGRTISTPAIHSSTVISFSLAKSCICCIRLAMTFLVRGAALGPAALMTFWVKLGSNLWFAAFVSGQSVVRFVCAVLVPSVFSVLTGVRGLPPSAILVGSWNVYPVVVIAKKLSMTIPQRKSKAKQVKANFNVVICTLSTPVVGM